MKKSRFIILAFIFFIAGDLVAQEKKATYTQGFFETDSQFTDRVVDKYLERKFKGGQIEFEATHTPNSIGGWYEKGFPYHILRYQGNLNCKFFYPLVSVDGNILKTKRIYFTAILYNSRGEKIGVIDKAFIKASDFTSLSTKGENLSFRKRLKSGMYGRSINFEFEVDMDKSALYSEVTVVIYANDMGKIFEKTDLAANFIYGSSKTLRIKGKYCYNEKFSDEIESFSNCYDGPKRGVFLYAEKYKAHKELQTRRDKYIFEIK